MDHGAPLLNINCTLELAGSAAVAVCLDPHTCRAGAAAKEPHTTRCVRGDGVLSFFTHIS